MEVQHMIAKSLDIETKPESEIKSLLEAWKWVKEVKPVKYHKK